LSAREARKLVTVVFCDLADSTAFADAHDPEVVTTVLARYFEVVRDALERHGGTVEKFIGDAVVGVFGVPRLREDDALRAVRAAAAIQDGTRVLNGELSCTFGVQLAVRVGVNSGRVLARHGGEEEGFAYGDSLNVAARLQQHAQAGDVLIGEATLGLVGASVMVEPIHPLTVKGKPTPVTAARLVGLADEAPAFERPIRTPFVGREQELAVLRDAVSLAREGRPQVVTLIGEPGIGKSRLLREVIASERAGASPLVGRCLPYGDGITYWPLAEMLRQLERRPGGIDDVLAGDREAPLIASRLGAARGQEVAAAPGEVAWAARRLLERMAESGPVIVIVDDIHWAEAAMLDLIEYVAATIQGPVLLLCAARPELLDARPTWATPRPESSLILLAPLSDGDVAYLAESLATGSGIARSSAERVRTWSAGNPLFVEQIMAAVHDGSLNEMKPPQSIQTLLASRVDQLPEHERDALTHAAVEGRLFHLGALRALADDQQPSLDATMLALVRKQFIRSDRAEVPGDDAYRFVHTLVRDAAYDALPISRRATLHERYADWLRAQSFPRSETEEIIAYHLEQAHSFRLAVGVNDEATHELASRAGEHLLAAGERADARWDSGAVLRLLRRAKSLLGRDRWLDVAVMYGEALAEVETRNASLAPLEETVANAELAGRTDIAWLARLLLLRFDAKVGAEAQRRGALAALNRFSDYEQPEVAAAAYRNLNLGLEASGRSGEAADAALRCIQIAHQAGMQKLVSVGMQLYGVSVVSGPTPAQEGIRQMDELLARSDVTLRDQLSVLPALAALHAMRCHSDETRRLTDQAARIQERRGAREGLAEQSFANWLGPALALIGDTDAAITLLRATCDSHRRRQDVGVLATLAPNLGIVLVDAGVNLDEADALCEESRRLTDPDDVISHILWRTLRAKLLRRAGNPKQALPFVEAAVAYAEQTDWRSALADSLGLAASLHTEAGSPATAEELRSRAINLYRQKGNLAGERRLNAEEASAAGHDLHRA